MALIVEQDVEDKCIKLFQELGYNYKYGPNIEPDAKDYERKKFQEVVLKDRLQTALRRINPDIPPSVIDQVLPQIIHPNIPGLMSCNQQVHQWLTKGITVTFKKDGQEIGRQLKLIDYDIPENNDWLIVNQFTVIGKHQRRPDLVVFINGLPISVIELKNPADLRADIWSGYNQLQTYKDDISDLFNYNVCLVIADGLYARIGALSSAENWFKKWRTINGTTVDPLGGHRELETLVRGVFEKERFLNYLRYFCMFEDGKTIVKKIAQYYQFHAVQKSVEKVVASSKEGGDGKGGVVWHTMGVGKSLEMAWTAGRLIQDIRLENPTIVVITDRKTLDGQLYDQFVVAKQLIGDVPKKIDSRDDLREKLKNRPSGGVFFSTIQKFGLRPDEEQFPLLSDRRNIVVIVDEAHRAHYGFQAKLDMVSGLFKYGFAKHLRDGLPNATYLAFTGTPISELGRDTQELFGEYNHTYDMAQAVDDETTVPIFYQSRIGVMSADQEKLPRLNRDIEEIMVGTNWDVMDQEAAKIKWAALEAIVGSDTHLEDVARDIIKHHEDRNKTQFGKALIVGMTREICARLYAHIIELKPEWHSDDHKQGVIKVVMTSTASDIPELCAHSTSKDQKKDLEIRFKDPKDSLKIVIVRDMWLTGFDVPCLSTMYVDKPMSGVHLAQAIGRVNRVFEDKLGGLIVDYIGIEAALKETTAVYTRAGGRGDPNQNIAELLPIFEEKIQAARELLHPINWEDYKTKGGTGDILEGVADCIDHILGQENGKRDYCKTVLQLSRVFSLCGTMEGAKKQSEEVAFYQAVRVGLMKDGSEDVPKKNIEFAVRDLIDGVLVSEDMIDIFELSGIDSPEISILSEEFLRGAKNLQHKNMTIEMLRRLIKKETKSTFNTNVVKQNKFSELLEESLARYANRSIDESQVIAELIRIAEQIKEDLEEMEAIDLTKEEYAFYDALVQDKSVCDLIEDEVLVEIAREIADKLRKNLTVDWKVRESVQAKLRNLVRSSLKNHDYPSGYQDMAVELILTQAVTLSNAEGFA